MQQNISLSNNYPEIQYQIVDHDVKEDSYVNDCDIFLSQVQCNSNTAEMGYNYFQLLQIQEEVSQNLNQYSKTALSIIQQQLKKLEYLQKDYPQPFQKRLEKAEVQMYIRQLLQFWDQQYKDIDISCERHNEDILNTPHIRVIDIENMNKTNNQQNISQIYYQTRLDQIIL